MKKITIGSKPSSRPKPTSADAWVEATSPASNAPAEPAEPTKRLTIEIPQSLHQQVKLKCVRSDVTIADVVRDKLVAYVNESD